MNHSTIDGKFSLESRGQHWSLRDERGVQVLLLGADAAAHRAPPRIERVHLQWTGRGADVELSGAGATLLLQASEAIVHQPLPSLYSVLPLARYDARAQRFWKRVFWLVRIPGGGVLLRMLARRARNKA
jgi:hypothetical protein